MEQVPAAAVLPEQSVHRYQAAPHPSEEDLAYADQLAEENREQYKKDCLDGGMTLVDVDRDAFRDALTDYYKTQFESKWTVTTYDEVMSYAE